MSGGVAFGGERPDEVADALFEAGGVGVVAHGVAEGAGVAGVGLTAVGIGTTIASGGVGFEDSAADAWGNESGRVFMNCMADSLPDYWNVPPLGLSDP